MHGILRMVATLLLLTLPLTMAAALPETQAMPFAAAPARHAAGCHGYGPATPVPASTSYECCVSGHQAAVPIASFSLRFADAQVCRLNGCDGPGFVLLPSLKPAMLVFPSNSPPGLAPLRI